VAATQLAAVLPDALLRAQLPAAPVQPREIRLTLKAAANEGKGRGTSSEDETDPTSLRLLLCSVLFENVTELFPVTWSIKHQIR